MEMNDTIRGFEGVPDTVERLNAAFLDGATGFDWGSKTRQAICMDAMHRLKGREEWEAELPAIERRVALEAPRAESLEDVPPFEIYGGGYLLDDSKGIRRRSLPPGCWASSLNSPCSASRRSAAAASAS